MRDDKEQMALQLLAAAPAVLRIDAIGGRRWKRSVAKGARIGPWLQANYRVVEAPRWRHVGPCLYLVSGDDGGIRYVGMSRNGLKDRWRLSPAFDAETMRRLPDDQLFHSQCWKHIEREVAERPGATFIVHSLTANELLREIERLGPPLSALAVLGDDGESMVAAVERWLCNQRSPAVASWNMAMTVVRDARRFPGVTGASGEPVSDYADAPVHYSDLPTMRTTIPVNINQSSIDNGRIYIDATHEPLLNGLRLGGRGRYDHGESIEIEAGGEVRETDIRRNSSVRLSPRADFKRYLISVRAVAGDPFRLVAIGPRRYRLEPGS